MREAYPAEMKRLLRGQSHAEPQCRATITLPLLRLRLASRCLDGLHRNEANARRKRTDQPFQLGIGQLGQVWGLDGPRMPQFGRHFMPSCPGLEPEDLGGDIAVL